MEKIVLQLNVMGDYIFFIAKILLNLDLNN